MAASGEFNHLPHAAAALHKALAEAVAKAAEDVRTLAQGYAAVDTGYMRDHIYTSTHEGSTYEAGNLSLPEVEKPPDDLTAFVVSAAHYSIYVEEGTSRHAAQPFMTPAAETERGRLAQSVGDRIRLAVEHVE